MRIEEKKFSKYINTKLVNFEEIKSYAYKGRQLIQFFITSII